MGPGETSPQDGIPSIRCPYCAELILASDRRCRYCHEAVDPALRGKYTGGVAYWDGDYLRVPLGGFVRKSHCLVCARDVGDRTIRRTFRYVPAWLWALLLVLPIAYPVLIFIAIAHEKQEIDVPACPECEARWSQATLVFRVYGVLALVFLPVLFGIVGNAVEQRDGAFYGAVVGFLVWGWGLFGVHALLVRRTQPVARKIDSTSALLRLPNASLVQTAWEEQK